MTRRRLGAGTVGLMAVLLVAYAVLHSPLRPFVDDLLVGDCRFFCRIPSPLGSIAQASGAVWLILTALAGAWLIAARSLPGGLERVVAAGVLAYGLIVVPSALLAVLGDLVGVPLLRPPLGPLLAGIPAVVACGWGWRDGWRPARAAVVTLRRPSPLLALLVVLVGVVLALRLGLAMSHPPTGFDDLGYHGPLAVLLWRDGSLVSFLDRFADTPVLSHPGGAELWQGLLMLLGGEPLGVVGQLPFALLGAAGVGLFALRLGLPPRAGALAGILFLLAPMVLEQSGHLRNDLVGGALVIATGALLASLLAEPAHGAADASARVGTARVGTARVAVVGLALGLMTVTKLALLPAVAALGLVLLIGVLRARASDTERAQLWRALALGLGLAALAVAPWWLRNLAHDGSPLFPLDIPIVGGGVPWQSPPDEQYVPAALLWPLYPLVERYGDENGLGGAFAVAILPALVGAVLLARRRPAVVLVALAVVSIPAWWLLDRREPRFLLGLAGLSFGLLPFALAVLERRWRDPAALILGLAATLTVGALLATTLSAQAERPVDRAAFYDAVWSIDPAALAVPEENGLLLDDRCAIGFGNRLYPFFGTGRARALARIDCDGLTTERIEQTLRRERLDHVYVVLDAAEAASKDALYPPDRFELLARSARDLRGAGLVLERRLYRWLGAEGSEG